MFPKQAFLRVAIIVASLLLLHLVVNGGARRSLNSGISKGGVDGDSSSGNSDGGVGGVGGGSGSGGGNDKSKKKNKATNKSKSNKNGDYPTSTLRAIPHISFQVDTVSGETADERTLYIEPASSDDDEEEDNNYGTNSDGNSTGDSKSGKNGGGSGNAINKNKNKNKKTKETTKSSWQIGASFPPMYNASHSVPPLTPTTPRHSLSFIDFAFGMATTAERALPNMDIWTGWLKTDNGASVSPPVIISYDQKNRWNSKEKTSRSKVLDIARRNNLDIRFQPTTIKRYEQRILFLIREMWLVATSNTRWFVVQDDDTIWLTQEALVDTISKYDDPMKYDIVIGAESEANMAHHGHIAYGGGGIIMSRYLVERLNAEGVLEGCYEKFKSEFGGDGIISFCIADVTSSTIDEIITYDDSLHQMDFGGTASFFFEAGPRITSLHHWNTWYTLFPEHFYSLDVGGDQKSNNTISVDSALLLTHVAKLLGFENFSRRFVLESGRVVVHLGYSVVFYKNPMTPREMDEDTKWKYYNTISFNYVEGVDKVSYFLIRAVQEESGTVMTYRNVDGVILNVVWSDPSK